jgi:3-oxoacyl-[acyl-carrier-protein] synthase III
MDLGEEQQMDGHGIALQILGTGEYSPRHRVESTELDQRWGKAEGWTECQTGVTSRAYAEDDESVIAMGASAARAALAAADVNAAQIDAIIAVGSVPYQAIPCTAVFIQRELGLGKSGIAAFDVNSTCLGFLVALDLISHAIATGRYRQVLIVASERASQGLNVDDSSTTGLFGDGAGAVLVGAPRRAGPQLRAAFVQSYGDGVECCQIRAGGSRLPPWASMSAFLSGTHFEMRGRETYKMAAALLPGFLQSLWTRAASRVEEIDVWVPHQASGRAITHLQSALNLPSERFVLTLPTHGNQVSASLPVALHRGITEQRIRPGDRIALIGTGAGISIGGAVLDF